MFPVSLTDIQKKKKPSLRDKTDEERLNGLTRLIIALSFSDVEMAYEEIIDTVA